jgi:glycosyltransferase involved in cell wall biosynthesis
VVEEIDVYGCLSHHALRCLREEYGRKGALTPGGVRLDRFQPNVPREPKPTLLYSGVLDVPSKGVGTLLEAVALLSEREPAVKLWLSGSGDPTRLLAAAPRAAVERTEILPIGEPYDQSARYSAAWATVLPSVGEAFGLVLVESLACGTPIVGTDDSAPPEIVEPGIGTLAAPRDARALADACARALALAADPSTSERCREVAKRHDWDTAVVPTMEEVYLSSEKM